MAPKDKASKAAKATRSTINKNKSKVRRALHTHTHTIALPLSLSLSLSKERKKRRKETAVEGVNSQVKRVVTVDETTVALTLLCIPPFFSISSFFLSFNKQVRKPCTHTFFLRFVYFFLIFRRRHACP